LYVMRGFFIAQLLLRSRRLALQLMIFQFYM
jgi:hypothetical protein